MAQAFINRHLSLAVKNAFIYLILILFSSFLIGYSVYRLSAALILASSKDQIKNEVQNVALKMTSYFDNIGRDIRFLSNNPLVKDYINSSGSPDQEQSKLTEEFKVLLESRPSYFQIRLIGLEDNGRELVRVDRVGNEVNVIPASNLQQKGDRNYFIETIKLKAGSVYFSEIDLNKEFGKLDIPYKPTLRAASPLYVNGKLFGIVIINTNLGQLFEELQRTKSPNENLFIFNNDAQFIIHPDESETFGFEFGKPANAYYWFPEIKKLDPRFNAISVKDSLAVKEKTVTEFYTLRHPISDYKLFIAISAAEQNILYPFISWRKNTLGLTLGITFAFLGIAFLWMRRQSKKLKSITASMVRFSEDYSDSKLPVNNTDEIGDLAKAFSNMASLIRSNVKDLESSRESAIKANQSKEEFLENMSHEVRNPLQSILGMTNILEQNNPRPDQKAVIKTIQFSSKQLLSLVNDILDFSKIRIGEIHLQMEDCDLSQLLEDIIRSHQFLAQSKNITLEAEIPSVMNDFVYKVDLLRLSQVLNNLIVNAIKFTPSGGRVQVSVITRNELPLATLHFAVTDNGNGIEPDEVEKILNRYYSGTSDIHANLSGSGLGLPIVTQLLKLFNAELKVQSELNRGSQFSFTLQLPCAEKVNELASVSQYAQQLPAGIHNILCIDDDPQILYFFKQIFSDPSKELLCLQDESELDKLDANAGFDLIIADFMLTHSNALRFLPRLASLKNEGGLLVIFSGIDPAEKINETDTAMVDGFIQKPMPAYLLFNHIQRLWNSRHRLQPEMNDFYKDYDYDQGLISHALHILIEEWKTMKNLILVSVQEKDQEKFNQVFHKIITTIRRFQLTSLLEVLEDIQSKMMDTQIDQATIQELKSMMDGIQLHFETQLKEWPALVTKY